MNDADPCAWSGFYVRATVADADARLGGVVTGVALDDGTAEPVHHLDLRVGVGFPDGLTDCFGESAVSADVLDVELHGTCPFVRVVNFTMGPVGIEPTAKAL